MARGRVNGNSGEALEALVDAATRAVHRAPESLLQIFARPHDHKGSDRLALRIIGQLAEDGWFLRRNTGRAGAGFEATITYAIASTGKGLLGMLSDARRQDGPTLDHVCRVLATRVWECLNAAGFIIEQR